MQDYGDMARWANTASRGWVGEERGRGESQPLCMTMGTWRGGQINTASRGWVGEERGRGESQPLCRTMGTWRGGQTQHPGGEQVRRGGGGRVSHCTGLWGHANTASRG